MKTIRNGLECCPGCRVILVVPHGHEPGCPHEGKDQKEIKMPETGVGTCCCSNILCSPHCKRNAEVDGYCSFCYRNHLPADASE